MRISPAFGGEQGIDGLSQGPALQVDDRHGRFGRATLDLSVQPRSEGCGGRDEGVFDCHALGPVAVAGLVPPQRGEIAGKSRVDAVLPAPERAQQAQRRGGIQRRRPLLSCDAAEPLGRCLDGGHRSQQVDVGHAFEQGQRRQQAPDLVRQMPDRIVDAGIQ